ncbi:MAG: type I pullulanase [Oscillospiraceae bacterium]|nr:type I pullulanase [Oscillospiraceae bacterium]
MKSKKVISLILAVLILVTSAVITVGAADTSKSETGAFFNQGKYSDQIYSGNDLGCTYTKSATTWKVWSPAATKVQLKLYKTGTDRENGAGVIGTYDMTKGSQGVWSIQLTGDYKNIYYTYLVTAANTNGQVETKETQDIYSKAVGCNGDRSMVVDLDSTDPEGWKNDKHVLRDNLTQSAVWELHIRDFSCDPNSGISEKNRGNYLAFTEGGTKLNSDTSANAISTGIDYLVEQGINTVQLMPFADYDQVDEINGASETRRNWGYNPKNYNVPDGSYCSNPYDGNVRINEVKQMVQALHDRGITVIMDVVYNHTAGYEASCFTKTVPGYYYRMLSATQYNDGSGQGCELASENQMTRNFIVQSLRYWVDEYHIDGFRFDLMGCIDTDTLNAARTELNKVSNKIIMYGEPWAGGSTLASPSAVPGNAGKLMSGIGMFSDKWIQAATNVTLQKNTAAPAGWVGGTTTKTADVVNGIKGNIIQSSDNTKTVNYMECHDDLALWDRITGGYTSSGEGKKSVSTNPNANSTADQYTSQLKLAGVLNMTSQGYSFMQLGTEFARTKKGQANSYNSSDEINRLDWSRVKTYANTVAYYRGLNQIMDVYTPFGDDSTVSKNTMSFISSTGSVIAYTINNNTANKANEWGKVAVLMNNSSSAQSVSLSGNWDVVANEKEAGVKSLGKVSGSYSIPARSGAILVESSSFKDFSNNYKYGTLTTNHYVNGTVAKTTTAKYKIGTTYHALQDKDILKNNDLSNTEGNASGTFTGDTTVNYYYTPNGKTIGTLKVNYVDQNNKTLTPSMSYELEKGTEFSVPVCSVEGYQLDTDKYPAGTTGTFTGNDTTINFTYKPLDSQVVRVHYAKSQNWSTVYCYAYTDDGEEPLGAWNTNKNSPAIMKLGSDGWYTIDIPVASCKVMFHGASGQGQEPGQNEPGYAVAGECWVANKTVQYYSTVNTSYIDIDTGKKLKADSITSTIKKNTDSYSTTGDDSLGTLVREPANAAGFCAPGVTNVVYLYKTNGQPASSETQPTKPTEAKKYKLGDSNNDGLITILDVTYIQQYLANLTTFNAISMKTADVDKNDRISIKDASYIQRYLLEITVDCPIGELFEIELPTEATQPTQPTQATQPTQVTMPTMPTMPTLPTTPVGETKTVLFSNSGNWSGTIYCYHWMEGETPAWPGDEMTLVGQNDYGQNQYSIDIPVGSNIIFTNSTTQTVDLVFTGAETGFYPESTDSEGKYTCGSW